MNRARAGLWRDRRGVAALETAIVFSALLVPLLAAVVVMAQAMILQYRLDRATHMGLLHAWGMAGTATTDTVKAAINAGYGTGNTTPMTASATIACFCMDQTGTRSDSSTTAVGCGGSCTASGQVLGKWVTAGSSASFTPALIGNWSSDAWTMQNSSTVRTQ